MSNKAQYQEWMSRYIGESPIGLTKDSFYAHIRNALPTSPQWDGRSSTLQNEMANGSPERQIEALTRERDEARKALADAIASRDDAVTMWASVAEERDNGLAAIEARDSDIGNLSDLLAACQKERDNALVDASTQRAELGKLYPRLDQWRLLASRLTLADIALNGERFAEIAKWYQTEVSSS